MGTCLTRRGIRLFGLLAYFFLSVNLLHAQINIEVAKPQSFSLPSKRAIPVREMDKLLDVVLDATPFQKSMTFREFLETLQANLPKKWRGVGFVLDEGDFYAADKDNP